MEYETHSYQGHGGHQIVYSDWGNKSGQPLVCVHGLTGNGHDFDFLAPELIKDGYRLICVDLVGRGRSDFLTDPLLYHYGQYRADLFLLLDHLGLNEPARVDWLGVSLGGLLGIWMAGEDDSPIRRLILNDIAPEVPQDALNFIYHVVKQSYEFDSVLELEQRMRETRGLSWGPMRDEHWDHMARHNARNIGAGKYSYGYDPMISEVFKTSPIGDADLWQHWDRISCPIKLLRGGQSLVLPSDLVDHMRTRGPNFDFHEFGDCGHVPSLWADDQIEVIREWLYKSKP